MTATTAAGVLAFTLGLVSLTGCKSPTVPIAEIETQLGKQSSDWLTTVRFKCGAGEAGWNYVCQARYEPASPRSRTKPRVQRVGIKRMGTYQGTATFSISPLPSEGRVLTAEELAAHLNAQPAEASQRAQKRTTR